MAGEHARAISEKFERSDKFESILIDYSVDDTVFNEFRSAFYRCNQGYRFQRAKNKKRYKGKDGEHLVGHELVKSIINNNRFFLFKKCRNWFNELTNYRIVEDTQQPQTWGDHFMDCNRYYHNRMPVYRNPEYLLEVYQEKDPEEYDDPFLSYSHSKVSSQSVTNPLDKVQYI